MKRSWRSTWKATGGMPGTMCLKRRRRRRRRRGKESEEDEESEEEAV